MSSSAFYEKLTNACHELLLQNDVVSNYLQSRGLKEKTIKSYKLGAFPKDLRFLFEKVNAKELREQSIVWQADKSPFTYFPVVIPINNLEGKPIAIGCRTLLNDTQRDKIGIPKYRNSGYIKTSHLFGLDKAQEAIRDTNQVFVVEGYFDVISAHQNNMMNVVATCGTMFSLKQLAILARYTENITLLFDNDAPGKMSAKRIMDKMAQLDLGINLECSFTPENYKDLDEYITKGGDLNYFSGVKNG